MIPSPKHTDAVADLEDDWTQTPWGRMYARRGGVGLAGTPVVLVHGLVVTSRYMIPLARRLATRLPVYAVDLPGYGRSARPERNLSIGEMGGALESWLAAKGLRRVHLVGNSMGCQVIADLAATSPLRVERIVLLAPTVDPAARSFFPQLWRQIQNAVHQPSLVPMVVVDYWSVGVRRSIAVTRMTLQDRIEEKLPRIAVPVLVVRGGRDPVCPQRWAEDAARLLPKGELRVIPGGGHVPNFTMPREVMRVILPFLLAGET